MLVPLTSKASEGLTPPTPRRRFRGGQIYPRFGFVIETYAERPEQINFNGVCFLPVPRRARLDPTVQQLVHATHVKREPFADAATAIIDPVVSVSILRSARSLSTAVAAI